MALDHIAASELLEHPENWRLHPSKQRTALRAAIDEIGFATAVVCYRTPDGGLGIIDGHLRAGLAGDEQIPVLITDLNAEEARALLATADPIAALALPDKEALAKLIAGLTRLPAALANLGTGTDTPSRTEPAAQALDRSRIISRLGDIWELGHHRLICGDATDPAAWRAATARRVARLIHTDPPYGVNYTSDRHQAITGDDTRRDELLNLIRAALKAGRAHALPDAAFYVWCASSTYRDFADALAAAGLTEKAQIVWVKPAATLTWGDYRWQHELCIYAAAENAKPLFAADRTQTTVWRIAAITDDGPSTALGRGLTISDGAGAELHLAPAPNKRTRHVRLEDGKPINLDAGDGTVWEISRDHDAIHPTQKPVALAARAIANSSLTGELVIDPFSGSGSTLLACEQLGRHGAAIELDPAYVDATVRRWQQATSAVGRLNGAELDLTARGATRPRPKTATPPSRPRAARRAVGGEKPTKPTRNT